MFIPSLDLSDSSQSSLYSSIGYIGSAVLKNVTLETIKLLIDQTGSTFYWAPATTLEEATQLWDAGIYKVIFPASIYATLKSDLQDIPEDRIALSTSVDASFSTNGLFDTSAVIVKVDTSLQQLLDQKVFIETAQQWIKTLLPEGGAKRIVIELQGNASLEAIESLQKLGIDTLVDCSQLTTDMKPETNKLNIGEAFMASATTDRPDGLYATLVVDELNNALGLVYSSKQSVAESIRTGQGVFQSRARGLWYKGATSGATQTLKRLGFDCDSDALRFVVEQHGAGFCHLNTRNCFGADTGLSALQKTLQDRKVNAPQGSYTARLFNDPQLLRSKIMEEAEELCDATNKNDIAWEAADLIYFALTKCVSAGVTLADVEKNLDKKARKITRRAGNAKPKWSTPTTSTTPATSGTPPAATNGRIQMQKYSLDSISQEKQAELLLRPIIDSQEITSRVTPIMKDVRERGDKALIDLTRKFDRVELSTPTIKAPFPPELMQLDPKTKAAIDQAYSNIYKFHDAQMDRETLVVETMPGVVCSRFARPIERVGLYVPGGTAVLPSTTLMLGIPAKVAGCSEIVIATPPRADGSVVPEVMYVAHKVGATHIVLAGGAQAVAAMAYGTETVPKVDKICGPGNQYVTAAKMLAQNDTSCLVSIDMPAGPSEVLVIADKTCNPAYVAADLLSQAEHGADSQVVLLGVDLTDDELTAIEDQVHNQAIQLPRVDIIRQSIPKSYSLRVKTLEQATEFSNKYAPEHLILHIDNAKDLVQHITNAGSVFVGAYSPESMGDYASGTNHTLPTYGYSRMYSGVNTLTFVKHITSQELTAEGLDKLGDSVMQLAAIEGLDAHRNAVAIRVADIRK
ncbi:histidinol dehydrogenase-domain-containing protein [Halteromyces radiatus]|uniref:histidinol dehydrogenase-domain-containing protein n=1 Tax=Halteromyces radiatus TaxID=101107 RepID=UPI00221F13DC|nr:histidinol dehydrogenase-domain-containing protein [Halteromyces radiatus]KAI8097214.1 histidinol dehydrogenase-domain-containing protein [Halteromyces radiatus]